MTIDARLDHKLTDPAIWSATFSGSRRWRLNEIKDGGLAPPGVSPAIVALTDELWGSYGSPLFVGTLRRNWEDQAAAHAADPNNAAEAGLSFHQPGYAMDIDLDALTCSDDDLTAACLKTGWGRISNEAWHLQWLGVWARLYAARGSDETAMAMCFDFGLKAGQTYEGRPGFGSDKVGATQAGLWRGGENPGAIDGFPGPQTLAALDRLKLKSTAGYRDLWQLRSVA